MTDTIIGHGTWFDKTALRIVERERKLGRSLDLIRTEMGIGISGIPHVGHVGDAARSYGVSVALMAQGYGSELVAFADDKDGLRKVPAGLPKDLEKYLGFPVREIPDPYKCHGNFAEHIKLLLVDALDQCGVQYRIASGAEMYEKGLLANEIKAILENAKKVGAIIQEEVGQEKYEAALPYFAVCSQCGRIYTTRSYEFLPNEGKVLYACEGMEVKGQWFDGCGHKGEADYRKGEGKLVWKVEFAARWKALDIRFEAYGKDIADSVRVNDRICREILKWDPPTHVQYEMFLDKSGKKISKSAGNVFTPQVWFRYGSPQSLVLLMLKRFVGTRSLSVVDIPQYMSELDELEDIFFGKKRVTDTKERAKLTGLYKYCWWLKPPDNPRIHVPYNLLVYLVRVAPTDSELDYVTQKLLEYGYLEEEKLSPDLDQRIRYARNWARDFEEIKETEMTLSDQERSATKTLIAALQSEADETQIQTAIFNIAREHNVKPRRFFKTLYTMLLGVTEGPRLGPYIVAMGRANVIDALDRALKRHRSK